MRRRSSNLQIVLACAAAAGACGSPAKTCPTIGCADSFTANVNRADGTFPDGTHRIEVLADGATLRCTFTYPLPAAPNGGTAQPTCDGGLQVMVVPAEICIETHGDYGSSVTCNPIPGWIMEKVTLAGAPGQVHVSQYVDDVAVLDAAVAPQYDDARPNGAACGPVCRQASAAWTLD